MNEESNITNLTDRMETTDRAAMIERLEAALADAKAGNMDVLIMAYAWADDPPKYSLAATAAWMKGMPLAALAARGLIHEISRKLMETSRG